MTNVVFVAPQSVYKQSYDPNRLQSVGYNLPQAVGLTKTKTGGMATIFPGHPFPRKTFIYEGITQPNNIAKRITLSLFWPFADLRKGLKAFLNSYLFNFTRLIGSIYSGCDQIPYLHYQYYSEFGKSLWDFIYLFLRKLGIKDEIAYRTGLQITTMIEYDDAYRVRIQDILHIASKEALLKKPQKEIDRLVEIYKQREITIDDKELGIVSTKFITLMKVLKYGLYLPSIKKAFNFALENINFKWFKLDEWDAYWTLCRVDYNCGGKTFEERKKVQIQMMVDYAKKINPDKEIRVEEENGQTLIKKYDKEKIA